MPCHAMQLQTYSYRFITLFYSDIFSCPQITTKGKKENKGLNHFLDPYFRRPLQPACSIICLYHFGLLFTKRELPPLPPLPPLLLLLLLVWVLSILSDCFPFQNRFERNQARRSLGWDGMGWGRIGFIHSIGSNEKTFCCCLLLYNAFAPAAAVERLPHPDAVWWKKKKKKKKSVPVSSQIRRK